MSDVIIEVKDVVIIVMIFVDVFVQEDIIFFVECYSDVFGKVNDMFDQVDWSQMGWIGKIVGIFVVVIIVQILIKGIFDMINLLLIVLGLFELFGVVVVGQWSWKNFIISDKCNVLVQCV